jgi:putative flippase GtrA
LSSFVQKLTRSAPPGQVVRYLIVGAWNTLFGYGVYCGLYYLLALRMESPYAAAMTASALGSVVCITVSFLGHKYFVFRTRGNFIKEYLRAFMVYGTTFLIGLILLPLVMKLLDLLTVPKGVLGYLAGAILTAGTVVVSFFGHKKFTFSHAAAIDPQEARDTG